MWAREAVADLIDERFTAGSHGRGHTRPLHAPRNNHGADRDADSMAAGGDGEDRVPQP